MRSQNSILEKYLLECKEKAFKNRDTVLLCNALWEHEPRDSKMEKKEKHESCHVHHEI